MSDIKVREFYDKWTGEKSVTFTGLDLVGLSEEFKALHADLEVAVKALEKIKGYEYSDGPTIEMAIKALALIQRPKK